MLETPEDWLSSLVAEIASTRWCPSSESRSVGANTSNFTLVYGRYIELLTNWFINQLITGGHHLVVKRGN